ncbi:MAG TPA: translation initiation factor eIF-1A [Candidatus Poseidoniaceae archaeon]|nr:MAG TPA: translation initiation factor eIF-1A [Candidatus Poseidoniales archaeon]DAC60028.1 MAG TPA: translation initiation factor eIF-1A [Candidatus Poseidoniales archaeon]HII22733.1 translation initiation factor eIF-1A [Candidatus Poseidoniaceae archaeon]HII50271.1 translation initiation factor eIF-1A [Candidatus Poseidoniaceae archaeon]|tara:strand:- start:7472 stop:8146 length:675 start_codon:yes stop_codon:yes gene_type:complete
MGRRHEEKVDVEELARLENPEDGSSGKIRVKMPNRRINEMFALADQILGGRRVSVLCEDGETRLARIPGKMRRRQWVREGDLIIVWPWDFQDSKADVKHRYTKTQAMYLSRKGVLPDDVDVFGMNVTHDDDDEHDDLFGVVEEETDDVDDMFGGEEDEDDDEVDDMFASSDDVTEEASEEAAEEAPEETVEEVEEEFVPVEEYPDSGDDDDDDDDDIDIDSLFG